MFRCIRPPLFRLLFLALAAHSITPLAYSMDTDEPAQAPSSSAPTEDTSMADPSGAAAASSSENGFRDWAARRGRSTFQPPAMPAQFQSQTPTDHRSRLDEAKAALKNRIDGLACTEETKRELRIALSRCSHSSELKAIQNQLEEAADAQQYLARQKEALRKTVEVFSKKYHIQYTGYGTHSTKDALLAAIRACSSLDTLRPLEREVAGLTQHAEDDRLEIIHRKGALRMRANQCTCPYNVKRPLLAAIAKCCDHTALEEAERLVEGTITGVRDEILTLEQRIDFGDGYDNATRYARRQLLFFAVRDGQDCKDPVASLVPRVKLFAELAATFNRARLEARAHGQGCRLREFFRDSFDQTLVRQKLAYLMFQTIDACDLGFNEAERQAFKGPFDTALDEAQTPAQFASIAHHLLLFYLTTAAQYTEGPSGRAVSITNYACYHLQNFIDVLKFCCDDAPTSGAFNAAFQGDLRNDEATQAFCQAAVSLIFAFPTSTFTKQLEKDLGALLSRLTISTGGAE